MDGTITHKELEEFYTNSEGEEMARLPEEITIKVNLETEIAEIPLRTSIARKLCMQFLQVKANGSKPKLQDPMMGLVEEVGELATTINVEEHGKKRNLDESSKEEAVDVILCALEIYFDRGGDLSHLSAYMEKKIDRWTQRLNAVTEGE